MNPRLSHYAHVVIRHESEPIEGVRFVGPCVCTLSQIAVAAIVRYAPRGFEARFALPAKISLIQADRVLQD